MNFPQFWARGRSNDFVAWGWSSTSIAEAEAAARQAAQRVAERFGSKEFLPSHQGYYPNRPLREQILQEIKPDGTEVIALITRNSYGCQVLNTDRVMFVDIDLPEGKRSGGLLSRLFRKAPVSSQPETQEEAIALVEAWTKRNAGWGWRLYRTRAGLRLLATHAPVKAGSAEAAAALKDLWSDPLYQKLCETQKCYRARLTPKPWRCGVHSKPSRWPWLDAKAEKYFQKWEAQYQSYSFNWATCSFLQQIGNPAVHQEVEAILKIHDGMTRADSNLKLA
jgi:hypothetical protein